TRRNLLARWAALGKRMQAAKDGGAVVELVIFYSGHGDVGPDGQGFLTLDDGKLTRADLFGELLASSVAQHNHILIDACRSEQFVLSRGRKQWKSDQVEGGYGEAVKRYLDAHQLGAFPNTGVVLAHSVDQQTHEWERYRGGIFTHELVSGLRGGADLNGDGHIEYSELGAFVSAANSSVDDPRARLQVVVRPPANDERRPILVHPALLGTRVLLFTGERADLWTVEDAQGVRIADVRRTGERPGYLRLPEGELSVVREQIGDDGSVREETTIEADQGGVILASGLVLSPTTQQARGAIDRALRAGLFATPYGPGYYAGYTDRTGILGVRDSAWNERMWAEASAAPPELPPAVAATTPAPIVAKPDDDGDDPPAVRARPFKTWGGIGFGTVITPFAPGGNIRFEGTDRVTSNAFTGAVDPDHPSSAAALRGFDLRWQLFTIGTDYKYPRWLGYFRTGYTAGFADASDLGMPVANDVTSLSYFTVPLFLGGNFYPFANFPLRPYVGIGAGLDILRLSYARHERARLHDTSARIGFELHAGLEVRITNHVALTAEIMQLWSARRRIDNVPDFSNEGFTIITGIAVAFPLRGEAVKPKRAKSATWSGGRPSAAR
ncbi:MAG: outer membrane beta-barrel protein, partial [Deltaproteobacteria bacterium]|nr:outer membrane beta-barrel protein [Nannocystaceae bacterium]